MRGGLYGKTDTVLDWFRLTFFDQAASTRYDNVAWIFWTFWQCASLSLINHPPFYHYTNQLIHIALQKIKQYYIETDHRYLLLGITLRQMVTTQLLRAFCLWIWITQLDFISGGQVWNIEYSRSHIIGFKIKKDKLQDGKVDRKKILLLEVCWCV